LLFLLQTYQFGFEVGRYASLERLIEQNKERYYETLELSSRGWYEGKHDPWPYINYLLFIIKSAYKEFEEQVDLIRSPRGEKTSLIVRTIDQFPGKFSVADIQKQCPGVSVDMIRRILKNLQMKKQVACLVRGVNAQWSKTDKWKLGNT